MENVSKNLTFYKGRKIDEATKVFVYYNLHKKCFSVKALSGEHKGKVVLHLPSLVIHLAEFVVNETGRKRVLKECVKNVHAGVRGYLAFDKMPSVRDCIEQVTYNPYKNSTFVSKDNSATVMFSEVAYLTNKTVWIPPTRKMAVAV